MNVEELSVDHGWYRMVIVEYLNLERTTKYFLQNDQVFQMYVQCVHLHIYLYIYTYIIR